MQALFKQLFSFVNVQLFNQLLLRRECCSFSNGEYVKTGLAQVRLLLCVRGGAVATAIPGRLLAVAASVSRCQFPVWVHACRHASACGCRWMQVESWVMERGTDWLGPSWAELKYIRQASGVPQQALAVLSLVPGAGAHGAAVHAWRRCCAGAAPGRVVSSGRGLPGTAASLTRASRRPLSTLQPRAAPVWP
jgi:hypothetical protein